MLAQGLRNVVKNPPPNAETPRAGNVLARQRAAGHGEGGRPVWEASPEHYHYNHMGSVAVVLDKWGGVVSEREQGRSLFGEVMVPGSGVAGAHGAQADFARPGLTTKHRDAAASAWAYGDSLPGHSVGKDYFGARWYDSSTARWLSEEPLGLDGPNMYNYLGGNSQRNVDLSGLEYNPEKCAKAIAEAEYIQRRIDFEKAKFDPASDETGGQCGSKTWSPYGHAKKINQEINRLQKQIKRIEKYCRNDDPTDPEPDPWTVPFILPEFEYVPSTDPTLIAWAGAGAVCAVMVVILLSPAML